MNTSKLDEIIYDFQVKIEDATNRQKIVRYASTYRAEAKAAIVEAVEGLVGKDDDVPAEGEFNRKGWADYDHKIGRNKLRAEQRKALKEWQQEDI